jgi:MFS family permease
MIASISGDIMASFGVDEKNIGAINAMYSIAAIMAVFFGGMLLDRLGTRKASIIFSSIVVAGASIVAFAGSIPVLYAGRFIFGAGSETLIVAQSTILARWFKGKELAMSFGIALTVSRIGSLFAFNTGTVIRDHFGGPFYALLAAALICCISLIANLVYIAMDRRGERLLHLKDRSGGDKILIKDIRHLKAPFWYVSALCVTFYSAVFPFQTLAVKFIHEKWAIPDIAAQSGSLIYKAFFNLIHMFSTAGGITSIIIFASMILAPFAGKLVDKIGRRGTLMIFGSLVLIPSHLLMGLTYINPIFPMIMLGAAFVLVPAALWPSIPLIVQKNRVGTAFGLMTAIQNVGFGLFNPLNGALRTATGSYTASQIMFASLGIVGLSFALLLKRADKKQNSILEKP